MSFSSGQTKLSIIIIVHIKLVSLDWSSTVLVLYEINIRPNCYGA